LAGMIKQEDVIKLAWVHASLIQIDLDDVFADWRGALWLNAQNIPEGRMPVMKGRLEINKFLGDGAPKGSLGSRDILGGWRSAALIGSGRKLRKGSVERFDGCHAERPVGKCVGVEVL